MPSPDNPGQTTIDSLFLECVIKGIKDALNRMQRASDVGDVVDYGYDLAGNRRWAAADYLTQLNSGSYNPFIMTVDSRAYWYKYNDDERMLLSQGVLSGGQIVLSQGQGAELGYDAHGNRAQPSDDRRISGHTAPGVGCVTEESTRWQYACKMIVNGQGDVIDRAIAAPCQHRGESGAVSY